MKLDNIRLLVTRFEECYTFYRKTLGLTCTWGEPDSAYASFALNENDTIALFKREFMAEAVGTGDLPVKAQSQDQFAIILRVEDLGQTAADLQAKGADVTPVTEQSEWGIATAHLRDPEGNLIELMMSLPKEKWHKSLADEDWKYHQSPVTIRESTKQDLPFMEEMLYQSVYIHEGEERPDPTILEIRGIGLFLSEWGRKGDRGWIAVAGEKPVGAIWMRRMNSETKTYGYVDDSVPVVSGLAVLTEYRGEGIGKILVETLVDKARQEGSAALSLSVDPRNPARLLYEKYGFQKVGEEGTSWTMKADL
ncbi:GNAT family N-acetyltransferase [Alteribacter natronophilus]|uniref:GNAT family N-acetyltransferase n=1 Tax=Alteribacter natronophilus TaxID=2583810 RepID=UPI00110E97C6|nr:GNAT family N-acetyltransferase [Alteribacter natronophilus]TMW70327.1 GNAT family N-acetyltransferase [Alteribacter natronophilus]